MFDEIYKRDRSPHKRQRLPAQKRNLTLSKLGRSPFNHIEAYLSGTISRTELRETLLLNCPDVHPKSSMFALWTLTLKHLEVFELAVWSESELRNSLTQLMISVISEEKIGMTDMVRDPRWWDGQPEIDKRKPKIRQDRHTAKVKRRIAEEFEL